MRFPTLDEVIAANEAVRGPDETSPTPEDDDLDRVAGALDRARAENDPIQAAAALAFEIAFAQGFYEGNKRTALLIARCSFAPTPSTIPTRSFRPTIANSATSSSRPLEVRTANRRFGRCSEPAAAPERSHPIAKPSLVPSPVFGGRSHTQRTQWTKLKT